MLENAKLYEDELKKLFFETAYNFHYKFAHLMVYRDDFKLPDSTWAKHAFVSLCKGKVIGFIEYDIRRPDMVAINLHIEHFGKEHGIEFGRDIIRCVKDIFEKFNLQKLDYSVVIGNPVEKTYDRLTRRYGGSIVGVRHREIMLMDGQLYDVKEYELLAEDYFAAIRREA